MSENKYMISVTSFTLLIVFGFVGRGASFANMDFQSPKINKLTGPGGLVSDLIPGWELQIGNTPMPMMAYNGECLSCAGASLYGPEFPRKGDHFTFFIKSGLSLDRINPGNATIFQNGDVPAFARSLQFSAGFFSIDYLHVSLNSQDLSLVALEGADSRLFGVDVSPWAGSTAELRFTVGPGSVFGGPGGVLADIHFSTDPLPTTPEPTTWALLSTGVAVLTWTQRKRRPWGYSNVS